MQKKSENVKGPQNARVLRMQALQRMQKTQNMQKLQRIQTVPEPRRLQKTP